MWTEPGGLRPETSLNRHHDWLSPEYASHWVADAEARDGDREAQLALLPTLIPHAPDAALRVLDLGAGYGKAAGVILAAFPRAEVTLLDFSAAMLEHARARLSDHAARARYALGDLSRPGWESALQPPYDAVVSAAVLHNLDDGPRIAAIYAEVAGILAPGGAFLNLDHVSAGGSRIEQRYAALHPRRQRHTHDVAHGEHSDDRVPPEARAGGLHFPAGLEAHLRWLHEAGFAEVDCFWKHGHRALYGGYLAPAP